MTISLELWNEAQRLITQAENRYERQRYFLFGIVTPEMEEEWRNALAKAEQLQAQAMREEMFEKQMIKEHDEIQYGKHVMTEEGLP